MEEERGERGLSIAMKNREQKEEGGMQEREGHMSYFISEAMLR